MTRFLYGEDEKVGNWIIDKIDDMHQLDFDKCVTIGVVSGDKLIAGVVYHDYQKCYGTIQLSMAAVSPMWAKGVIIHELLRYPFEQLNCYKIMISIRLGNIKALKTVKHIGFVQEAILSHVYGKNRHAAILQFLEPDYNQIFGVK